MHRVSINVCCCRYYVRATSAWKIYKRAYAIEATHKTCIREGKRGKFKLGDFERPSMTRMPSFERPSIKRNKYQPYEWVPGRFRYIKPTIMSLGKLVITDRARRKHILYLTRRKIMEAHRAFFKVQNQKLRKEWSSHSNNPW